MYKILFRLTWKNLASYMRFLLYSTENLTPPNVATERWGQINNDHYVIHRLKRLTHLVCICTLLDKKVVTDFAGPYAH